MYAKIRNVQILVSLLKQHGIKHLVLSAGTRHVPVAHSVENDDFFHCYSVVDERSAGYFAIGLSLMLHEPVAVACTSSTATCNYTPAVAEAYYQKVPLLLLTGDRDPYRLDQLEDQMINQVDMYKNFCKKCVNLPVVRNENDEWYCQRLINEALLELNHHGSGPVQINFPIVEPITDIADASVPELPMYNRISRYTISRMQEWEKPARYALEKKRILIVCGANTPVPESTRKAMEAFAARYNCVFATEALSNLHFEGTMDTYHIADAATVEVVKQMGIDHVIFFGGNYISRLKVLLRNVGGCESWVIAEDGKIQDPFATLTAVFECGLEEFFSYFAAKGEGHKNDGVFRKELEELDAKIKRPTMEELLRRVNKFTVDDAKFKNLPVPGEEEMIPADYISAIAAIEGLAKRLPAGSLVNTSILHSTRIFPYFCDYSRKVETYSNLGTDGIDGTLSTFLGMAYVSDRPCYLVIGDLSFFYGMNAIAMRNIRKNVHIFLINNGGGAEFYYSMGPKLLPNIDLHISAGHSKKAEEWVKANGFRYFAAHNMTEFQANIDEFMRTDADAPAVFEIFTEKYRDVKMLKGYRRIDHITTGAAKVANQIREIPGVKEVANTAVGQKLKSGIKGLFGGK